MRMTRLELYEHVQTIGVGAVLAAALLTVIALGLPLVPSPEARTAGGAKAFVPTPRPRPMADAALMSGEFGPARFKDLFGPRVVPTESFRAPAPQPQPQGVAAAWPALPVEPSAMGTPPVVREGREGGDKRRTTRTKATCQRHGLRTEWSGKWTWRCRR